MTAVNFPDEPVDGQIFEITNRSWRWVESAQVWESFPASLLPPIPHAESHELGGLDELTLDASQVVGPPTTHAESHELGGLDELTLDASQVIGIVTDPNPQIFLLMGA
jgi:hypothetical protein